MEHVVFPTVQALQNPFVVQYFFSSVSEQQPGKVRGIEDDEGVRMDGGRKPLKCCLSLQVVSFIFVIVKTNVYFNSCFFFNICL